MPERVVLDTNIAGDHHLLDLGKYEGIRILSAAEFVALFG